MFNELSLNQLLALYMKIDIKILNECENCDKDISNKFLIKIEMRIYKLLSVRKRL